MLNFHDVRLLIFLNTLCFTFQHFGLKLPISGSILTIFDENRQKCENYKRHIRGVKHTL